MKQELVESHIGELEIRQRIKIIRGVQVMLDRDLAELYGVEVKQLNRQVKRNIERFPADFMFQLSKEDCIRCQIGTLYERGGKMLNWSTYRPLAFTENGIAMLSGVLRSPTAIAVNIRIMRAFTVLRHFVSDHAGLVQRVGAIELKQLEQKQVVERQTLPLGKEVFVVHGHDNEMLLKVKEFLTKSGLHPIVLREQPNEGRTIIEKFENEAASTGFAVVLLTPDDVGRDVNEANGENPRARQNVVFEMGYFIGKFGRRKVAAICDPSVERPGDVAGVVYIDSTSGNDWKIALMKELRAAGYDVDPSALLA